MFYTPLLFFMKDSEPKRRGRRERSVPQRQQEEYTAAERMRLARQNSGKTLVETGKELGYNPHYLSYVESGIKPVNRRLARQYEQLFQSEPGQIVKTVFERPRKSRKQQK